MYVVELCVLINIYPKQIHAFFNLYTPLKMWSWFFLVDQIPKISGGGSPDDNGKFSRRSCNGSTLPWTAAELEKTWGNNI